MAHNTYLTGGLGVGAVNATNGSIVATATSTALNYISSNLGAVGAPAYTFTGDLNTGLWSSAADTLNFSTAGSERVRIDSSGNVGIGTTTPLTKLDLYGSAANLPASSGATPNGDLRIGTTNVALEFGTYNVLSSSGWIQVHDKTNQASNYSLLLNPNGGNVGIGTTSPATTLSVAGNGYFTGGLGVGVVNTSANTVNLASGGSYQIAGTSVLNGTTLGSGVTASSLTSLGTVTTGTWSASTIAINKGGTNATSQTVSGIAYYNNTGIVTGSALQFDGTNLNLGDTLGANGTIVTFTNAGNTMKVTDSGTANVGTSAIYGLATQAGNYGALLQNNAASGHYCYMGLTSHSGNCDSDILQNSDIRLKKDIAPLDPVSDLAGILQIQPVSYRWKDENRNASVTSTEIGFIAQNVQQYFPQLVDWATQGSTTKSAFVDGPILALSYDRLIVPTIGAIQALNAKVDALSGGLVSATSSGSIYSPQANFVTMNASTTNTSKLCLGGECRTAWGQISSSTLDLSQYVERSDLGNYALRSDLGSATSSLWSSLTNTNDSLSSKFQVLSSNLDAATSTLYTTLREEIGAATSSLDFTPFVSTSTLAATLATSLAETASRAELALATSSLHSTILGEIAAATSSIDLSGYITASELGTWNLELGGEFGQATTTAQELATASSSVSTTTPWIASFASASQSLRDSLASLADTVIHVLGRAVYATVGVFENIYAKVIAVDLLQAQKATAKELCVSDETGAETCITKQQLDALLAGQVAGTATSQGNTAGGNTSQNAEASPPAPGPTLIPEPPPTLSPEPSPEPVPDTTASTTPQITPESPLAEPAPEPLLQATPTSAPEPEPVSTSSATPGSI